MLETLNLDSKVIVITGGGTGLGLAMVRALARAGADICIAGRRAAPIESAAEEVRALGRTALAVPTDISDSAQVDNLVSTTLSSFGHIDVLINNAALVSDNVLKPIWEITDGEWQSAMDVNLNGAFYCSRAVSKPMADIDRGRVPDRRPMERGRELHIRVAREQRSRPDQAPLGASRRGL